MLWRGVVGSNYRLGLFEFTLPNPLVLLFIIIFKRVIIVTIITVHITILRCILPVLLFVVVIPRLLFCFLRLDTILFFIFFLLISRLLLLVSKSHGNLCVFNRRWGSEYLLISWRYKRLHYQAVLLTAGWDSPAHFQCTSLLAVIIVICSHIIISLHPQQRSIINNITNKLN